MKADPPHDSPQNERWDERDPLWRVLGESPAAAPSDWFATSTIARCRRESREASESRLTRAHLLQIWRWALGGGVAVSMVFAFMTTQVHPKIEKADDTNNVQEAFAIMASVDTDSDSSSSSWQDSSN